jgi:hypothetical protein
MKVFSPVVAHSYRLPRGFADHGMYIFMQSPAKPMTASVNRYSFQPSALPTTTSRDSSRYHVVQQYTGNSLAAQHVIDSSSLLCDSIMKIFADLAMQQEILPLYFTVDFE